MTAIRVPKVTILALTSFVVGSALLTSPIGASEWAAGSYHVLVQSSLEDLAGNCLDRPFDVEDAGAAEAEQTAPIRLPFTVQP